MQFRTKGGIIVPVVDADQMREIDRVATEGFGLNLFQMMENAGRDLAENVMDMGVKSGNNVVVLAGHGGNGGGGLCAARHLHNRGVRVSIILDQPALDYRGVPEAQLYGLESMGIVEGPETENMGTIRKAEVVIDALIGYNLKGKPFGRAAKLIKLCNQVGQRVISLDIPSGLDATTGSAPGAAIRPERVLTLALPKAGLISSGSDIYLADIGIPVELYREVGLEVDPIFTDHYWLQIWP